MTQASMKTARAMVAAVDRELDGIQRALLTLGTSPSLTSDDLSGFYQQAREVLKTLNVDNIVLIDPTFRQRMNTHLSHSGAISIEPDQVGSSTCI